MPRLSPVCLDPSVFLRRDRWSESRKISVAPNRDACSPATCPRTFSPAMLRSPLVHLQHRLNQFLVKSRQRPTMNSPPSVSCQTMPSRVTDVPGSQGPKHSGSVIVPTLVPTHTSDMSCNESIPFIHRYTSIDRHCYRYTRVSRFCSKRCTSRAAADSFRD